MILRIAILAVIVAIVFGAVIEWQMSQSIVIEQTLAHDFDVDLASAAKLAREIGDKEATKCLDELIAGRKRGEYRTAPIVLPPACDEWRAHVTAMIVQLLQAMTDHGADLKGALP